MNTYQTKEQQKEYTKWMKKAKNILAKLQAKADAGTFYENFGEKEYRKFREEINNSELSYGKKADIAGYLSEKTGWITPNH